MKFTDEALRKEQPPEKGQRLIFDQHRDAPRGFGLRITQNGVKSFILKYTIDGRQGRKTIGRFGAAWSVVAARERAKELRREIDKGVDVLQSERENRQAPTVAEAAKDFITGQIEGLKSAGEVQRYFDADILPAIGKMKVAKVTRRDLHTLVADKAKTAPRAARIVLAILKQFFRWCEVREDIPLSPAEGIRPKDVNQKMRNNKRGRVLDHAEIASFWTGAESAGFHRLSALALKLVLVTGQRPGEVAGMTWQEVNGEVWTIPASRRGKTEDDHVVPLTATALDLLAQAKREVGRLSKRRQREPSGIVFETGTGEAITTRALSRAVVRNRATIANRAHPTWGCWTPHDLRRTCRTGMAAAGVIGEIAERVVGHVQEGMHGVYNLHHYDAEKRAALEAWERRLLLIVAGEDPDKEVAA